MKLLVSQFLARLAKRILAKYQPIVFAITGSIGKTSARDAIFAVVSQKYRARASAKSFNNELGLPLTIIGISTPPEKNILRWVHIFARAIFSILFHANYPEVLVLELGIDHPGEMDMLLDIANPSIGVLTSIGVSHYQFFENSAQIENEKAKIATHLPAGGFFLVNADSDTALRQQTKTLAGVVTFGFNPDAQVHPEQITESLSGKFSSHLKIKLLSGSIEATVKAVGKPHITAVLAGVAAGSVLKIEHDLIIKGVETYKPHPGRLHIIGGIKRSIIIDDSYNASSPESVLEGIALLSRIPALFKIAVIGDMLELGSLSDEKHEEVGQKVAGGHFDRLVTVGAQARIIASAAKAGGMDAAKIISFDSSDEAKKTVQELIELESAVLVKGSQGVRMEKITKEIMAEPMRAQELLCRQYGKWLEVKKRT